MKRHLFYLLALMLTFTASCSKDPEGLDAAIEPAAEGKYRLATLSATLDGEQTRTGEPNATTGAVNWSAKDRVLIIRTSDYASWQYELVKGANTPIGEFEPIIGGSEASSDDPAFGDIIAVYPVAAAYVDAASKKLSFRINQNWYPEDADEAAAWKERLSGLGITSWNKDTAHAFTQNDIKVSYKCTPASDNRNIASANFKFRQLGAWCKFEFDFTADETIAMESLQSIRVTTVDGNVRFTGTAEVQLADDTNANPTLRSAGDATEIYWQFNSPSSMSSLFTRSMMMYPGELDGQRLKIVAETNLHTFTFYATPKLQLQAGTVYHFPIGLGFQDYKQDDMGAAQATDLAYTMVEKGLKPFYYYGGHNSYIVKPGVAETVYCTPYKTDAYYHKTGTAATLDAANRPTQAKVIWYETAMGEPTLGAFNASDYTFTVTTPAGKYGNALVGVYNAAGKILWSYHIWVPQDDPTKTLTYANTKSGTYEVMPLNLGATKVAVKGETPDANRLNGAGLYYQWGRKDPLGRAAGWTNNYSVAVKTVQDDANGIPAITENAGANGSFFTQNANGTANRIDMVAEMVKAGYAKAGETFVSVLSKKITDTDAYESTADQYMVDVAVANPTKFIYVINWDISNWSAVSNTYLWGNPKGYDYPRPHTWSKSIFDPCPKGYRIAPRDLWINFQTDENQGSINYVNVKGSGHGANDADCFNRGFEFYYKGMGTTIFDDENEACGYDEPTGVQGVDWDTDFYIATGLRRVASGELGALTTSYGCYWSGSPMANSEVSSYYICFNPTSNGIGGRPRGEGCTIRCVKEPQQ